jgi:sugar/nucleoside kinase (ribokinase family)
MMEYATVSRAMQMRGRLSEFLTRSLDDLTLGWPRLRLPQATEEEVRAPARRLTGLRVVIIGDLVLEVPIEVDGTREELLALFRPGCQRLKPGLRVSAPRAGGFVAHAAKACVALGAEVSVCTVVPVPTPECFESFFKELAVDRQYLAGLPGPCPISIVFGCKDGRVSLGRQSIISATSVNVPIGAVAEADVIMADPSHLGCSSAAMRHLACCLNRRVSGAVVGLRLDPRCKRRDLAVTRDERVWTFVRRRDARQLAERVAGGRWDEDEDSMARRLHERGGIARLVLQLGPRGAVLLNGVPCPYHVRTCPLDFAGSAGAGHVLLAVTTLSSASGADDRATLRRGVAAATGHIAGLDLPISLEELDAA